MRSIIRWGSYPVILGTATAAQIFILTNNGSFWPSSLIIVSLCLSVIAVLERIQPYQAKWNEDHNDTLVDILHAAFSLSLIFLMVKIVSLLRQILPSAPIWPIELAIWLQVFIAGLIIDFGLWFMHWLSHKSDFLWRLHVLHHSSKRLYWLNGERRHPISAVLLASPGLLIVVYIGAPPEIIGAWFAIVAVHLAFQHANLDYKVGVFRNIFGVAEVHRWHHKRDYQDSQVNFGEFWMIWDQLFWTFRSSHNDLQANEVGVYESTPTDYLGQLRWPFKAKSK